MNWIKKKIFLIFAVLVPGIIGILLLEFFLKFFLGLGQPIIYDESSIWGYSPRAEKIYNRFDNNLVSINDVGLRSTEPWKNNPNEKILFFGDSVTYGGSFVDDSQLFTSLACKELFQTSCFNGGVNAHGILNMINRSRFDSRLDDADTIVFVFIWGDFLRGLQKSDTAHFIMRNPPKYFSAIWEVFNFLSAKYSESLQFGKKADKESIEFNDPYLAALFAYENLKNEVKRLNASGKKVLLISSPSVDEILGKTENWIKEIEGKFLDDFPSIYHPLLGKKLINEYKENKALYKDSVHLEAQGHALYGEIIGDILKKEIRK